jgi:hypothetical protein
VTSWIIQIEQVYRVFSKKPRKDFEAGRVFKSTAFGSLEEQFIDDR